MTETKIWLNGKKTRYCRVKLFSTLKEMRDAIKAHRPNESHPDCFGQCAPYEWLNPETGRTDKDIATVFLCVKHCEYGIVAHELMHACLWAFKFKKGKVQYPVIINNMKEEEELLYELTYTIRQFYNWFYKVGEKRANDIC